MRGKCFVQTENYSKFISSWLNKNPFQLNQSDKFFKIELQKFLWQGQKEPSRVYDKKISDINFDISECMKRIPSHHFSLQQQSTFSHGTTHSCSYCDQAKY